MNPVTRIHSHIWSTRRISIAVYFIIKLSQLQAAKSYDSHRLIYRAIGREPRIPRHWGHGVVLERWIVEKKRRHSINSLSSLLLPSYFHARSTSLFYIFRETRVEREKRFIEISKRPRSHDPINRKTGFPYSNSPPPLVLPWFFLSFHDPPPPHDHWIVSMNQPNIYIYIYIGFTWVIQPVRSGLFARGTFHEEEDAGRCGAPFGTCARVFPRRD